MARSIDIAKELVVTPEQVRDYSHAHIDKLANQDKIRGISSGIGSLDEYLNPLQPGRLRVILARPGAGKSSLMMHFMREASKSWRRRKDKATCPPVFVTAEMAIEEIAIREVSNYIPVDSVHIERGTMDRWDIVHEAIDSLYEERPIVYIGHSLASDKPRPRMSMENIWRSLEYARDVYGVSPECIAIDYAQRIRLDSDTRDRRGEVSEVVERAKDMALAFATPVVLGSQASRAVESKNPPIPGMDDAKETGNLEETADDILALMRPSRYYKIGESIPKSTMICREELFYVMVLKQRQGRAGQGFWLWFDMSITRLADMERIDLS